MRRLYLLLATLFFPWQAPLFTVDEGPAIDPLGRASADEGPAIDPWGRG